MTPQQAQTIALWIIWFAAPAATLTPLVYGFGAPWWRTVIGRALMTSSTALALLVDLSLLFHYWQHISVAALDWISLSVYALVALGAWLKLIAIVHAQFVARRP